MKFVVKSSIGSITSNSKDVVRGSLFLAYPGSQTDGRLYIDDAIKRGATAVLWESEGFSWQSKTDIENIPIKNLKHRASEIADQFYGMPSEKLQVIGVTGTNGKTSITQWLSQCLNNLHQKTAVIGSLGNGLPNKLVVSKNTTPESVLLQSLLHHYVREKVKTVAMEVSSHGLDQGRVSGVRFTIAVLSNLTRDHLDYHETFEQYADAKRKLFHSNGLKAAVLNADDAFGRELQNELAAFKLVIMTYGIDAGDVRASQIHYSDKGFSFLVTTPFGQVKLRVNLIGKFNVYNVLAVLTTLLVAKVGLADAVKVMASILPIKGRMQKLGGGDLPLVVIDYAHTPDALENILLALKQQNTGKLICVFGCGGDRDAGKRTLMGRIASQLADSVVVTSDNPRNENPASIIQQILDGVTGQYAVEQDRAKAIALAIAGASLGDIVLVAGKGHEEYQILAEEKKHYFSDEEQARAALMRYEKACV